MMGLLLRLANSHGNLERAHRARQLLRAQLEPGTSLLQRIAVKNGNHRRSDVALTLLAAQLQNKQTKLAYRKSRIKR